MNTLRLRRFICLLLVFGLPVVVQAQFTYTINYLYTTNNGTITTNGTITITKYIGSGGAVIIPDATNGWPVVSIGTNAFENSSVTSVTIPNTVTNIGETAFYSCGSLTNITIPDSVTRIGLNAFGNCSSLTAITVGTQNSVYSSLNGVLFDKNQTTLIEYPGGKVGSYTIPNSVTNIGDYAFYYCTSLTGVTIPNSVTSIGDDAFDRCFGLTSVTIPNSVTSIGFTAFYACTALSNVAILGSVTNFGEGAFGGCSSLTSVTLGNGVTSIGIRAFTFCTSLTNVIIPISVTNIGDGAFSDCTSLTAITVDSRNSVYTSVNGVLFDKNETTLIEYPGGKAGSYAIPDSVTSIGNDAFNACIGLTSVTIPKSVTEIQDYAFDDCVRLTSVTIPNSVTSIGNDAFFYCTALTALYLQGNAPSFGASVFGYDSNLTIYYLSGTTGWGLIFVGRPVVLWDPQATTLSVTGGNFDFNIAGPTNAVIVVEACTNLVNPIWVPVSTNTLSSSGTSSFSDSHSSNYPSRFYRFRSP